MRMRSLQQYILQDKRLVITKNSLYIFVSFLGLFKRKKERERGREITMNMKGGELQFYLNISAQHQQQVMYSLMIGLNKSVIR